MSKKCPECGALSHQPHADACSQSIEDTTERLYAEMEAARAPSMDAYFKARPAIDEPNARRAFQAGFERAFRLMWKPNPSAGG